MIAGLTRLSTAREMRKRARADDAPAYYHLRLSQQQVVLFIDEMVSRNSTPAKDAFATVRSVSVYWRSPRDTGEEEGGDATLCLGRFIRFLNLCENVESVCLCMCRFSLSSEEARIQLRRACDVTLVDMSLNDALPFLESFDSPLRVLRVYQTPPVEFHRGAFSVDGRFPHRTADLLRKFHTVFLGAYEWTTRDAAWALRETEYDLSCLVV